MPLRAIGTIFSSMLMGLGRPDINLLYVSIALVLMSISFLIGVKFGITGLCLAWVVGYFIVFLLTLRYSLPVIRANFFGFIKHNAFIPAVSVITMLVVYIIKSLLSSHFNTLLIIILQSVIGALTFISITWFYKKDLIDEIILLFPSKLNFSKKSR